MKPAKPSDFEMQILSVLWEKGPSTVRELLPALPDGKQRAYTSVLSVMQVMEKKKLLKRKREGLTDRWQAAVKRETVIAPLLRRLVDHVFGGRPSAVMQHLLAEPDIGDEELRSIKKLIRDYEQKSAAKAERK